MLYFKDDVEIGGVQPETVLALTMCNEVFKEKGYDTYITSLVDGKHGKGSKHYIGFAFDLRTKHLQGGYLGSLALKITDTIKKVLGINFDVVLEKNHIHVEYDPKTGINLN